MTPTAIEKLLIQGSWQRSCTLDEFRAMVEDLVASCNVTFEQALRSIVFIDALDDERDNWLKFMNEYQVAKEEAQRIGVSVSQLVDAYVRLQNLPVKPGRTN